MGYQTSVLPFLQSAGLTLEFVPGWQTRGSSAFNPAGVVDHWTAGPRNATGRPSLNIVVNGRSDLAGPLCNFYLDRAGIVVVVAAGRANHAGVGGIRGLVGNSSVWGIEAESAGDNPVSDWTDAQRASYPKLNAALIRSMGKDASWVFGHNEWSPGRKIDIRDWDMPAMRAQTAAALGSVIVVDNPIVVPPAPAPVVRQRNIAQTKATQIAVHATPDTYWGDDTERRVNLVRAALNGNFPQGIRVTQDVVGTKTDGLWGPNSRYMLGFTVGALQSAWGCKPDRSWGPITEAHWIAARAANYKVW